MTPPRRGPVLLVGAVVALAAGSCGTVDPPAATVGPPTAELRVGLVEWGFTSSSTALLAGPVHLQVTNAGSTAHDLRVLDGDRVLAATTALAPGAEQTLTADVSGLRQVRFLCTLPGHESQGMVRDIQVIDAPTTTPAQPRPEEAPS